MYFSLIIWGPFLEQETTEDDKFERNENFLVWYVRSDYKGISYILWYPNLSPFTPSKYKYNTHVCLWITVTLISASKLISLWVSFLRSYGICNFRGPQNSNIFRRILNHAELESITIWANYRSKFFIATSLPKIFGI